MQLKHLGTSLRRQCLTASPCPCAAFWMQVSNISCPCSRFPCCIMLRAERVSSFPQRRFHSPNRTSSSDRALYSSARASKHRVSCRQAVGLQLPAAQIKVSRKGTCIALHDPRGCLPSMRPDKGHTRLQNRGSYLIGQLCQIPCGTGSRRTEAEAEAWATKLKMLMVTRLTARIQCQCAQVWQLCSSSSSKAMLTKTADTTACSLQESFDSTSHLRKEHDVRLQQGNGHVPRIEGLPQELDQLRGDFWLGLAQADPLQQGLQRSNCAQD